MSLCLCVQTTATVHKTHDEGKRGTLTESQTGECTRSLTQTQSENNAAQEDAFSYFRLNADLDRRAGGDVEHTAGKEIWKDE